MIELDEDNIIEQNGERYIDIGGIYALIIDEEDLEKYKPEAH